MSLAAYEEDYAAWLDQQARTMRRLREQGSNLPLDLDLLADELDEMGRELSASYASHAVLVIQHLLKLAYSPST